MTTPPATPPPPQGVRLEYTDGRRIPLSVQYVQTDAEGIAQWEVVEQVDIEALMSRRASLALDVLPARTSIGLSQKGEQEVGG